MIYTLFFIYIFVVVVVAIGTNSKRKPKNCKYGNWHQKMAVKRRRKADEEMRKSVLAVRKKYGVYVGDKWDSDN